MGYRKCPRCELNYILDTEKMCSVCLKDVSGEKEADDMIEMCSECGENPAMPGQELCSECFKALQRRNAVNSTDDAGAVVDPTTSDIDIDSVSGMEEMEEVKTTDEDGMDFSADDDTPRDDEEEEEEGEESEDSEDDI